MEKRLSQLEKDEEGIIKIINTKGELRKRLLDMGFIKGVKVKVVRKAPLGDPIELNLKGFFLSLRLAEADQIIVTGKND